jgi:long-chain acyl-CoA synthetase
VTENVWNLVSNKLISGPDQAAWICRVGGGKERVLSYSQIYKAVLNLAASLRQQGITAGDKVGVMAPNGPEWTVAAFAIWKLGAILVPIHSGNSDEEIREQVSATAPKIVLSHQRACTDIDEPISLQFDEIVDEDESSILSPTSRSDEAALIYTSGSTGNPKIVRLSHKNLVSNVIGASKFADLTRDDRILSLLPFSHAMGLTGNLLLCFYVRATLVAPKALAALEIMRAMEENQISVLIAVPRLFRNIMLGLEKKLADSSPFLRGYVYLLKVLPLFIRKHANLPIRKKFGGNLNCWVSGGSRLDPEIKRYFLGLGISLRQGYGLTETSPAVAIQSHFDPVMDSVGKVIENCEVKVDCPDEDGSGEIWIKGDNIMLGYTSEKYTKEVMNGEWFKTGDIGRIDATGNITLTGRSKRLIVTDSGKNVYPEDLEIRLERDSAVKEAAVLELDMKPVAIFSIDMALFENTQEQEAEMRRVLKDFNSQVSSHNRISRFALIEELPRTPLGKIALHKLPVFFSENEIVRN